ncbi:MAG: peptide/nickel transport system permease protein, partial [Flavobacteriaceae bacterium]
MNSPPSAKPFSGIATVLRDVVSRPSGSIGLFLVVFHVLLAILSPLLV